MRLLAFTALFSVSVVGQTTMADQVRDLFRRSVSLQEDVMSIRSQEQPDPAQVKNLLGRLALIVIDCIEIEVRVSNHTEPIITRGEMETLKKIHKRSVKTLNDLTDLKSKLEKQKTAPAPQARAFSFSEFSLEDHELS